MYAEYGKGENPVETLLGEKSEEIPFRLRNFAATKFIKSVDQHRNNKFLMTVYM